MPLDAEAALDLSQAGSDAVRCFPTGMWGVTVRAPRMRTKGTGSTTSSLGLRMSEVAPLPQFPPEAEWVLTAELLKLLHVLARLKLEEAKAG